MHFQYSPYIIPLLIAAVVSTWMAVHALTRRVTREAVFLGILALAITEWLVGYALEISGADLYTKRFFGEISYLGISFVPLMWFVFAYLHSNKDAQLNLPQRILLAIIPVITFILALTNPFHGLIWTTVGIFQGENFSALKVTHGWWFWVHSAYSYILLLMGTIYIFRSMGKRKGLFRWQTIALLIGVLSPWVGNILYLLNITPIPYLDVTPFAFTITVVGLTWGILGFQLIDVSPVARDFVVEHMQDGVVVCDARNLITDVNSSAQRVLEQTAQGLIGRNVEDFLTPWPEILAQYQRAIEGKLGDLATDEAKPRWYELYLSQLVDQRGRKIGRIVTIHEFTERKLTEDRLGQLNQAVESSPISVVITDTKGMIEYVNPRFSALTGYSSSEAIGQSTRILKTEYTPRGTHQQLWETISEGNEWHGEFCNRKKDGSLYWEMAYISPIRDLTGTVTHYVAMKEDITEQRSLQNRLRRRNEYLSILHQVSMDLLNRRNLDDLLEAIVNQASALLNAPYVELMLKEGDYLNVRSFTKSSVELVGDRVKRNVAEIAWQAHDSGAPVVVEDYSGWLWRHPTYAALEIRALANFPVMGNEGCIAVLAAGRVKPNDLFTEEEIETGKLFAQLVALVLDNANLYQSALSEIAERKRGQQLLLESETRYRQIVENASDLIYRMDLQGRFMYVNQPTLHLLGYQSEQDLLGKPFYELAAVDAQEAMISFYQQQLAERKFNTYYEYPASTADGSMLWLGQNVQLIFEVNQVVGLQALARDITQIKQGEAALAGARDQALEASQLKSTLLAKVSHELRTPLGAILGFAELLSYGTFGDLTPEQGEVTGQIIGSVNFLNEMVNELLDEAQISAKRAVLKMEDFSLSELLERVQANMAVLAGRKKLEFSISTAPNLTDMMYGDERRLQQILVNLIGNAIKYTLVGKVNLEIFQQDSSHWGARVSDTGIGMPAEALQYIFDPFRQVDGAIKHENRGTGLGLTITKQLVELMGGQISVESNVGQGSTFTVVMPVIENLEKMNV